MPETCWDTSCSHPTTQRPTTATNHIKQNQRSTPYAVTNGLWSPEDGHNDARNMLRHKLLASNNPRPTTATNHIKQNQRSKPYTVTHGLCSPDDGHNDARNMLRQKLITGFCVLLVSSLSLHTFLTMHGHRNLKIKYSSVLDDLYTYYIDLAILINWLKFRDETSWNHPMHNFLQSPLPHRS